MECVFVCHSYIHCLRDHYLLRHFRYRDVRLHHVKKARELAKELELDHQLAGAYTAADDIVFIRELEHTHRTFTTPRSMCRLLRPPGNPASLIMRGKGIGQGLHYVTHQLHLREPFSHCRASQVRVTRKHLHPHTLHMHLSQLLVVWLVTQLHSNFGLKSWPINLSKWPTPCLTPVARRQRNSRSRPTSMTTQVHLFTNNPSITYPYCSAWKPLIISQLCTSTGPRPRRTVCF